MAGYRLWDVDNPEEFFDCDESNGEYISIHKYMETIAPQPEETFTAPEEDSAYVPADPAEICKNGDITKLLQSTPGILPPADKFSRNYKPEKPKKRPDIITDDKIPILLGEQFFKFKNVYKRDSNHGNSTDDGSDGNKNHLTESKIMDDEKPILLNDEFFKFKNVYKRDSNNGNFSDDASDAIIKHLVESNMKDLSNSTDDGSNANAKYLSKSTRYQVDDSEEDNNAVPEEKSSKIEEKKWQNVAGRRYYNPMEVYKRNRTKNL